MNLSTTYLGMTLKHPIVASPSVLSEGLDKVRHLEDAGAAAVVLFSLFEEDIPEASDAYLNLIHDAKRAVDIPMIGSLNGSLDGMSIDDWVKYARRIEGAGADALELNLYHIPTDVIFVSSNEIEQMYLDILTPVKKSISLPVAVKISPYFSSTAYMTRKLAEKGADALVLFNRFYQPDFDLENLNMMPNLVLSNSTELLLPLHWVAILYGRVPADFAITGGVHTYEDVIKAMMVGAKVAMMASELLKNGLARIREVLDDMRRWLDKHGYHSMVQMEGRLSYINIGELDILERAGYRKVLQSLNPQFGA